MQLGRIAGWETAIKVGQKTFKKGTITHDDIIDASYDILGDSLKKWNDKFNVIIILVRMKATLKQPKKHVNL